MKKPGDSQETPNEPQSEQSYAEYIKTIILPKKDLPCVASCNSVVKIYLAYRRPRTSRMS